MISDIWKFSVNGGEARTAESLGVSDLSLRFRLNGPDEATFRVTSADALTAAPGFAYGDTVIITRGTRRVFYGRVTSIPREGTADSESVQVTLEGPWWYLRTTILILPDYFERRDSETAARGLVKSSKFQYGGYKTRSSFTGGSGWSEGSGTETYPLSEAVDQVLDYVTRTRSPAAPITVGTVGIGTVYIPRSEVKDMSCADALIRMLAWVPDSVIWFDHSTVPYPTIHIKKKQDLAANSQALSERVTGIGFAPRHDMVASGVVCFFEWDGSTGELLGDDARFSRFQQTQVYPPGTEASAEGVLSMHIDLESTAGTPDQTQTLHTKHINPSSESWWQEKIPWLADGRMAELKIHSGSVEPSGYNQEIVGGTITDWMEEDLGFTANSVVARARVDFKWVDGNSITKKKNVALSITLNGSNKAGGTFTKKGQSGTCEQPPPGLAQRLYEAMSILHWQGDVSWVDGECGDRPTVGQVLHITGGLADWETMGAMIYEVEWAVDSGKTTVSTGVPPYLTAGQIIEMWRANRRTEKPFRGLNADPDDPGGGAVRGPGKVQNTDGTSGEPKILLLQATDAGDKNTVALDGEKGQIYVHQETGEDPALRVTDLETIFDVDLGGRTVDLTSDEFQWQIDGRIEKQTMEGTSGEKFEVNLSQEFMQFKGGQGEVYVDLSVLNKKVEAVEAVCWKDGQAKKFWLLMEKDGH